MASAAVARGRRKAERLRRLAAARLRTTGEVVGRAAAVATAAKPPLGKSQSYRPTPVDQHKRVAPFVAAARQDERWRRLRLLRKLSSKERVRKCKTPIGNGRVGVVHHDGGAHLSGLESCGNVWACPVCAPKIRSGRMGDVLEAFERHAANGGGFAFMTLTIWHQHGEALADLLELLGGAWKSVAGQREYKEWKQRLGLLGNIMALEVTDGVNSWHPHRHVMLFFERPPSRDEVAAFEAVLDDLYGRWLEKQGREKIGVIDQSTGRRVGVRLDYVPADDSGRREQLGKYLTKLQAGFELTRGDLKQSRADSDTAKGRLPMDLIDLWDRATDPKERAQLHARWVEYETAMTGKSSARFSKGLRALLGMEDGKTDQQLAEEEVGGEAGVYLSAPLYRRLFKDAAVPLLLQTAATYGDVGVMRLMQHLYPGEYAADELAVPGAVLIE